jgi:hypothetical protein
LDLLGQLALPLPCLLRTLQLQAVLVHRESHGLVRTVVSMSFGRIESDQYG